MPRPTIASWSLALKDPPPSVPPRSAVPTTAKNATIATALAQHTIRSRCGRARTISLMGLTSQPARVDVGHQDASRTDLVQLVHDPVGVLARDHRLNGHPALAVQRRDRRRLD